MNKPNFNFTKKHLGIISLSLSTLFITSSGLAGEMTAEDGIKRIEKNIEISTANRDEYNKAIEQVNHNIITLDSASLDLQSQKKKLTQQFGENKKTLTLHTKKIQEIDKARQDEEKKKLSDQSKITQLEKTLADLKALQAKRQERIEKLMEDRATVVNSQKDGETLQVTLGEEMKTLDQRIAELKKEVSPWKTKKKTYEKESARWNNELDRHQKMETEVKLLVDETT